MTTSNAESTTTRTEETVTPYTMTTSNAETSTTITTTTRRSRVTSRDRYLEDNDSNSNPDYIYHDTFKDPGLNFDSFICICNVIYSNLFLLLWEDVAIYLAYFTHITTIYYHK